MNWQWLKSRLGFAVCLLICFGGISLALPRQQSISSNFAKVSRLSTPLSVEQLQQLAKTITVKISAQELLGSGTLLKREGEIYTVITNAHVLRAAKPPYQIQTPDGRLYQATMQIAELQQNDLAVLQFRSPDIVYPVANIKDTSSLQVGDEVFVGGFTSNLTTQKQSPQAQKIFNTQFVFTSGKVTLLLDKALEQGYQIGYTNDVRKGMSGAPLLNIHGEVVGINSLYKDPLWDTPEVYQDGSQPEQNLQKLITQSSMAVPIKSVNSKQLSMLIYQENQS
ncbi:trypsin-like peptidase domain-containing protein [Fortiea sp. LEGE XX443]|uniref:S1 family peptidase n=1 Tax=Fortiea sp. LEGE XX443 TaxID=1828611 RepID=UPI00187FC6CF|nr:serine protease [Fortiea sp. LEGE XX443]MBE9008545.1 trypsin-like peptidase domain-containing protein [Fortiea sp. LEGE XX443]